MAPTRGPAQTVAWLRVFLAVAESGSFSDAAELTRLSQPTISQHVRLLEDWLGTALFRRHGRGVALTDAGRQLQGKCAPHLKAVDAALLEACQRTGESSGTVSIASVHTIAAYLLPQTVLAFARLRPQVRIRVLCRGSAEVVSLVERGKVEIGLVYDSMVATGDVVKLPLHEERMAMYGCQGTLPEPTEGGVSVSSGLGMISFPEGFALRRLLESHYPGQLNIICEVETLDLILHLVSAGAGLALLPDCLPITSETMSARIQRMALREPAPTRLVVAITRRSSSPTEPRDLLLQVLDEHASLLPQGPLSESN